MDWSLAKGNAWTAAAGMGFVYLRTQQRCAYRRCYRDCRVYFATGRTKFFCTHTCSRERGSAPPYQHRKALQQTERFWKRWCDINTYDGPWKDAVERSLITLKALTYRPTGGIVAAPTTSLPERLGGDRNWDYRYCWLRDAAFTLESLLSVGYQDEARAWQEWLLQAVGSDVRGMQVMYGMRGERHLPECQLPWLRGYRKSQPVRMGNAASEQLQLDVYGEVADAIASMVRPGYISIRACQACSAILQNYVASIYQRPASGLWEQRDRKKHYTYSKVMAWLALQHGVAATGGRLAAGWKQKRDRLHRQICRQGFNRTLGSFVRSFGSNRRRRLSFTSPNFRISAIRG